MTNNINSKIGTKVDSFNPCVTNYIISKTKKKIKFFGKKTLLIKKKKNTFTCILTGMTYDELFNHWYFNNNKRTYYFNSNDRTWTIYESDILICINYHLELTQFQLYCCSNNFDSKKEYKIIYNPIFKMNTIFCIDSNYSQCCQSGIKIINKKYLFSINNFIYIYNVLSNTWSIYHDKKNISNNIIIDLPIYYFYYYIIYNKYLSKKK